MFWAIVIHSFSSCCHQRLCEKDIRVGFEGGKDRFYVDILQEKVPVEEHDYEVGSVGS